MFPNAKAETVRWYLSIWNGYLKFYKNPVVSEMMLAWPQNVRTNVDWLSPQEAIALIDAAVGIERVVVHLELRLWFRRVEVRRLRTVDIKENVLDVHGKGRCGGKWRTVSWGPDTLQEFQAWDLERERLIAEAQKRNATVDVPEQWLIYRRGKRLGAYGNTSVDNLVISAAKRAGIDRQVSNHTLRRTGGRMAWYAGVDLLEIMEGMGHSNPKQTVRYLGLRVDDLWKAQERIFDYMESLRGSRPEELPLPSGRRITR